MSNHNTYIKRCIQIAENGLGNTRPNPMVGAVIVYDNTIIGEGFTSAYGGNHAEVNAIASVKNTSLLKKATLYVTLEPCSHFGKTPPCSDLIIKHRIPNVVIGCIDDNPEVAGKGIKKLTDAGCNVTVGVLEAECKAHHKRFFTFHNKKRPYIILKWAESNDGFLSPETKNDNKPVWITNAFSRQLVHKWRSEEHAILVGTNTVIADNPSLTVRDWTGQQPIRVVLDRQLKLAENYAVFDDLAETIIFSEKREERKEKRTKTIEYIDWDNTNTIAKQMCEVLYSKNIQSVIIEGGTQTLQTFINEDLWDEARVFSGNIQFKKGVKAPVFSGDLISEKRILNDVLKTYKRT